MTSLIFSFAGDDDLGGDVDVGPGSFTSNLDSVGDGRSGGVGPARTAILRHVLVSDVSQEVASVDVVPEHRVGQVTHRLQRRDDARLSSFTSDTARLRGVDLSVLSKCGNAQNSANCKSLHVFRFCHVCLVFS